MATVIAGGGGRDCCFIKGIKNAGIDGIKHVLYIGFAIREKDPEVKRDFGEVSDAALEAFGADTVMMFEADMKSVDTMKRKIDAADLIFIGGGSTLMLMMRMRRSGLDKLLIDAYNNTDKVLCGDSAGGLCWAKYGNADSRVYKKNPVRKTRVTGLGILDFLFCAHVVADPSRQDECKRATKILKTMPGLAFDNAAIIVKNGKYKTFAFGETAFGHKCYWKNGEYYSEDIMTDEYRDLKEITEI